MVLKMMRWEMWCVKTVPYCLRQEDAQHVTVETGNGKDEAWTREGLAEATSSAEEKRVSCFEKTIIKEQGRSGADVCACRFVEGSLLLSKLLARANRYAQSQGNDRK